MKKHNAWRGGRRSVERSFRVLAAHFLVSPRRPAGSDNYTALPSSACLIAEVRRVNIVHISKGWSAGGRKLQKLSSGIEEAERSQWEARESRWRRCRERGSLLPGHGGERNVTLLSQQRRPASLSHWHRETWYLTNLHLQNAFSARYTQNVSLRRESWQNSRHCHLKHSRSIVTFAQVLQSPEKTPRKETTPRIIVILFFLYAYNTLFGYVGLCFTGVAPPPKKINILKAKSQQMCRNLLEIINLSPQVHFFGCSSSYAFKSTCGRKLHGIRAYVQYVFAECTE